MRRIAIRTGLVVISALALVSLALFMVNRPAHQSSAARAIKPISTLPRLATTTAFTLGVELVTGGLAFPTYVASPADGSGRLFVLEQAGRIRVISNSVLLNAPYLDISNTVSFSSANRELGLLGMAFDPAFASNGTFYLDYTNLDGNTNIERFVVAHPAADVASLITATRILTIAQPYTQHKGGVLQFGPNDGYLYIGMGDGGLASDAQRNGQNPNTLLGKILRIDVRNVPTYTIPSTNPFTQTAGIRPEIWASGVRNPWRFSFDRANGDLYIGDVGQHCYEEIDYQSGASHGGENYGWNIMEGFHGFDPLNNNACAEPVLSPPPPTLTLPVLEYPHSGLLTAVIGGYVYRGTRCPPAAGMYFYADLAHSLIWSMAQSSPGIWTNTLRLDISPKDISSFGEDSDGELYLTTYSSGEVYHLVLGPLPPSLAASTKTASSLTPLWREGLTYTIVLKNGGLPFTNSVQVTDTIPQGLGYLTGSFTATLGTIDPSAAPVLRWSGVMSDVPVVTLTYAVTAATVTTLTNAALIDPGFTAAFPRSITIFVSRQRVYLPIVSMNR